MGGFAAARLLGMTIVSWLAVVAVSFVFIRLVPGDPVEIYINRMNIRQSDDLIASYRLAWGLDRWIGEQFIIWLRGFVTFDWGVSFETGGQVIDLLLPGLGWSAAIGFGGMTSALSAGFMLGYAAALHPGQSADRASRALAIGGQALPAFALGLVVLWVLAVQLKIIHPFSGGIVESLLLPVLLVAFFSIGSISRIARAAFLEVAFAPYMRTARAKGHSYPKALWLHGYGHAAIVLMAGIAPDLAWIVGGTAVAEIVFSVPGLSERVIAAVAVRDYPVLQCYLALVALWIVLGLAIANGLRRRFDPRVADLA